MENYDRLKKSVHSKIAISKFKEENMAMKKNRKVLAKTLVAACACLILTGGIVFAKDIEKIVKNLFSNSNEAVNQAVENGYVQSVTNDFTYDKDIGVKVDNIVLDELNLNVSFKFETDKENIDWLRCNKFVILTDTGEKIFDNDQQYVTDINDVYTAQSMTWSQLPQKVSDNTFSDSILFTMGDRSREKKELYFRIQSLDIVYQDGTREEIEGTWNIDVTITDQMRENKSIKYKFLESNEHLEGASAVVYPTGLVLELNLKEEFDFFVYRCEDIEQRVGMSAFYLKDNDKFIEAFDISSDVDWKTYTFKYDTISSFDAPEKLEIYLEPWDETITLVKSES